MKNRNVRIALIVIAGLVFWSLIISSFCRSSHEEKFSLGDFDRFTPGEDSGPHVGVVKLEGVITESQKTIDSLRRLRKNNSIKAVVLYIDSPGGVTGPAQEMYREVIKLKQHKPVVAALGGTAASGGYYVAAACDKIIASPGTVTGSIGAVTQTTHFPELLSLARIETNTFVSGKFKDTGSPFRHLTDEDKKYLQKFVEEIYEQFLDDVSKGRNLPKEQIRPIADGRIISGAEALKHKLIDQLGNFTDALEIAARLANATGDPVPVYIKPKRGFIYDLLSEEVDMDNLAQIFRRWLMPRTSIEVLDPRL